MTGKSRKHMQLSQPRTKDYARRDGQLKNIRGTLQSQKQSRLGEEEFESESVAAHMLIGSGMDNMGAVHNSNYNNYHSPIQMREMGLSQQMMPNQMK